MNDLQEIISRYTLAAIMFASLLLVFDAGPGYPWTNLTGLVTFAIGLAFGKINKLIN